MANPFGSADQALTKNTSHANQANLIAAWVPRSATKIVEVIGASTINPAGGNYDADGFWRFNSTTRTEFSFAISRSAGQAQTIITAVRYNSGGDVSVSIGHLAGMFESGIPSTNNRFLAAFDRYSRVVTAYITDNTAVSGSVNDSSPNPGGDTFSVWVKGNSATPVQDAKYRISGASSAIGSGAVSGVSSSDGGLTRVGVAAGTKWAHQYVFLYDAVLSDADIEAIIDDPGAVLTQASSFIPRRMMLGVG